MKKHLNAEQTKRTEQIRSIAKPFFAPPQPGCVLPDVREGEGGADEVAAAGGEGLDAAEDVPRGAVGGEQGRPRRLLLHLRQRV